MDRRNQNQNLFWILHPEVDPPQNAPRPIVAMRNGKPLAVKLAKLEEGGIVDQMYEMGNARSFLEFKKALSRQALPFMNTIYADREGNIFYIYGEAIARRSTRFDWTKPVD